MSRQTEKVFKQLNAYLTEHEGELQSEEDVNRLVEAFMAKQNAREIQDERPDAGDYLEMAQNARSKKKRLGLKDLSSCPSAAPAGTFRALLISLKSKRSCIF